MTQRSGDLIGKTLGTCTLEKRIGQGGMGEVYLARQQRPSRYVAIKILRLKHGISDELHEEFLLRFRREADLIARLEHANIMPIYEYGEQDGLTFLVMPYSPGGSLRDGLTKYGAFSLQQSLIYIEQAASALDYAHTHGVIHRDIKPSNFLLHTDGRLLLADFGIARMMESENNTLGKTLTSAGMLLGTPEYMAPEMARGENIDARADVYELGVVFFQMLRGHVPFRGETPLVVVFKQLEEPLPSLHQLDPAIPSAIDRVLQKATAKKREDRYNSAGEFALALRQASTSEDALTTVMRGATPVPLSQPGTLILPNAQIAPSHLESVANPPALSPTPSPPFHDPITPGGPAFPMTPYPNPASGYAQGQVQPPHASFRPWLIAIVILLVMAVALGGVVVGLQLQKPGGNANLSQTNLPAPTPTLAPTPTEIPTPTPEPTATLTPNQQAQAVVQAYFDDINNGDYHDAYDLWGATYQASHSYSSFSSGFSQTINDTVTFTDFTTLQDGTIQVSITLQTLDQSSSGTTTNTFQGYYVVGQEDGVLKLLSAHITKTS